MLSFETLNLVWSKEFIAIAWVDEDFEGDEAEDAVASLKESIASKNKVLSLIHI